MKHPNQQFEELGENSGPHLARSTIEKIAHEHPDPVHNYSIKRRIAQYKPVVDDEAKEWRFEYAEWALAELNKDAIFIFSDETYSSFGSHPHTKQRVNMGEGQPAEYAALHIGWNGVLSLLTQNLKWTPVASVGSLLRR